MRRFFDPKRWRTVLFDRARLRPLAPKRLAGQQHDLDLIADIERLREHLGVEKWTVFGGSWGSTLALAYAIAHPERVQALILRGVFLRPSAKLHWFYQDGASMLFPDAWERFLKPIRRLNDGDMVGSLSHVA